MGLAGGKAKGKIGKKGKVDKGGGKGGKGGVWTTAGDHCGFWVPTRAQIKGSGGFPFPSQHQYAHPWHAEGKGAQPGAKLMIGNGGDDPEEWAAWMSTSGYAMSLRQVPARAAVETSNTYAALAVEEPAVPDPPEPPGSVPQRAGRSVALLGASRRCCGLTSSQCRFESANSSMPVRPLDHAYNADETAHAETRQTLRPCRPKLSAKAFLERRTQSLKPLASGWEKLQMILDSGASVSVVPPSVGRDYEVVRGEAAMAGVRYEIADGNEI